MKILAIFWFILLILAIVILYASLITVLLAHLRILTEDETIVFLTGVSSLVIITHLLHMLTNYYLPLLMEDKDANK